MNIKLSIILFGLIALTAKAQNSDLAKAYYEKAQTSLENRNYQEALSYIEKSKQNAGGTNPDIMYVELKTRYHVDSNINKTKSLINQFLNDAFEDDERRSEVSKLLVEIETSGEFHKSGQRKKTEYTSNGDKIIAYCYSDGYEYRTEKYGKDRGFRLTSILYREGETKVDRKRIRKEWYKENGEIDFVNYYLDNKLKIKIWGKGEHVHFYDKNEDLIQRIGLKGQAYEDFLEDIDGTFYSFKSFNSWDDNVTYFKSGYYDDEVINEWHNLYPIQPIEQHKRIKLGLIKVLRVGRKGPTYYKEYYKYYFDESGVPTKKESYKRGKLKKTYTFNRDDSSWSEI